MAGGSLCSPQVIPWYPGRDEPPRSTSIDRYRVREQAISNAESSRYYEVPAPLA